MNLAIQTENLGRTFKSYKKSAGVLASLRGFWDRKYEERVALSPTNLQVEMGQIIGLVGANGAGKTTLLKLLSGLIHPSQGTAKVLGFNPWERSPEFLKQISLLLGQKNQLWWDLPPVDSFSLLTEIYDRPEKATRERVQMLAELLNCTHVLTTQLRRLSLGERMKMEIIGSLLHEPKVLFLDEPTIGLDIVAQTSIRNFLIEYVKVQKTTVILTSHYMDDIAKLADRLLLISKGSIVYDGTVESFVGKTELQQKISFSLASPLDHDFKLSPELTLKAGQQEFSLSVHDHELPQILSKIVSFPQVHSLKLDEVDFEDIIHSFLEKESRVLPTRHPNSP